jgi:hypothetical protein
MIKINNPNPQTMNKLLLSLGMLALAASVSFGQGTTHPLVTITQVQQVPQDSLIAVPPKDTSPRNGDTVRIRGRLVTLPGQAFSSQSGTSARWVWIQSGTGPWSGMNYRPGFNGASGGSYDFSSGIPGDSVEVVGVVNRFPSANVSGNETQMSPWNLSGGYVTRFPVPPIPPSPTLINACELNDANRNWQAATGEKWEGVYCEIQNATVVDVPATRSDNRQDFVIESNGCRVTVYATFNVMRTNASTVTNPNIPNLTVYPNFVPPLVGEFYTSIKGVINYVASDGYTISPWDTAQFTKGVSVAPQIVSVSRSIVAPTPTQSVTVTANVNFTQGTPTVRLVWAKGLFNPTWDSVTMTASAGSYTATIPAVADSAYVKYFVRAIGVSPSQFVLSPVNAPNEYTFYRVSTNGLQIQDLQFTPFANGISPYRNQIVTVTGVVTASQNDLERIFIQQEGVNQWAGLEVTGNLALATLSLGNRVTITGTCQENFGFTRIGNVTSVVSAGTGTITPVALEPQLFATTSPAAEVYEGMLVRIQNNDPAPSDSLYIIQTNADGTSNFGEFRIGKSVAAPTVGIRVKTGRYASEPASPNVSLITPQTSPGLLNDTASAVVVTLGRGFKSMTGLLFWSFSNYKLYPRNNADVVGYPGLVLGVENEQKDFNITLFPNPANTEVAVRVDGREFTSFRLLDLAGREVLNEKLSGQFNVVNIAHLPSGTYLTQVVDNLNSAILQRSKLIITK